MDNVALQGLGGSSDPTAQRRAVEYFEHLKSSENGWQMCADTLNTSGVEGDHVRFFCLQVVEHFIKTKYATAAPSHQQKVKEMLMLYLQMQACGSLDKTFLRNKAAQLFSLVFVADYPRQWPTFFTDLICALNLGVPAVDLFLRVLMAIDSEMVDRDIVHTMKEVERNTVIKDAMREQCVPALVDSWYQILTTYETSHPEQTCMCLEAVGHYISWIDINLIANDRFIPTFVRYMSMPMLRESAADCFKEIISKGMDACAKMKLIDSLMTVLENAGIFNLAEDEDADYLVKLAAFVNTAGNQLLLGFNKTSKSAKTTAEGPAQLQSIEKYVPLMLRFLGNDDDDVSTAVCEFASDYVALLKTRTTSDLSQTRRQNVETMLYTVITKMKYDDSYNFDSEGEEEIMFQEFRKQMKVLFDNIGQLDRGMVLLMVHSVVTSTLQQWDSAKFEDVELAIFLLYNIGEALPASQGNHFIGDDNKVVALKEMMRLLISSHVSRYSHTAVQLQFFETVVRYEKYFNCESDQVPEVMVAFLDSRGLHHQSCRVRSRVSYLFSRFIKSSKAHLQPFVEDILKQLEDLLVVPPAENGIELLLSPDDQLFLYEAAAVLIVSSSFEPQKKQLFMKSLLAPIVRKFSELLEKLALENNEQRQQLIADALAQAMAFASRTSKAFSNQQPMKQCGCVEAYTETLQVFLTALSVPVQVAPVQSGVRQYLHRMVVCLEDDVMPYIPAAVEALLQRSDARSIQEFIPLINQIVAKFKKLVVPLLQQVFMPFVRTVFSVLSVPAPDNDLQARRDAETLQRSYFLFLSSLINNGVTEVIAKQAPQDMQEVLSTVIHGAVNSPDPVAQKTCFNILRRLVESWGTDDSVQGFVDFMYKSILPACFMAPLRTTFDLQDAQTVLALNECALCLKTIADKRGDECIRYLQNSYLPTMQVAPEVIQEYCLALKSDQKVFKSYLKVFFQRAKT